MICTLRRLDLSGELKNVEPYCAHTNLGLVGYFEISVRLEKRCISFHASSFTPLQNRTHFVESGNLCHLCCYLVWTFVLATATSACVRCRNASIIGVSIL